MSYVIKQIPTHYLKFCAAYNNDFVQDLKKYMNVEAFELFTNSIFGPYADIHTCNYQGQISKCLLLLEIDRITLTSFMFGMRMGIFCASV
ncbi:hypothetical protein MTR67_017287 [Solanum verrucosum]|uniref:Uncharacterized protein n=1 Tax=Solanum verrucosum TaxID=315347 RepID=A0AAF0TKM8_SOLVR|nr:hypothetical protein MTR67_017287 [Solanum verrucosum]